MKFETPRLCAKRGFSIHKSLVLPYAQAMQQLFSNREMIAKLVILLKLLAIKALETGLSLCA
ncbi:hypothetical protein AVDCRST_MAG92-1755 [uncultured Coleofasciculus sp.]|uniref:Uncharacterized protein n=1 Tax=uncultured Coleofasciculus sp. TaxID=1267456 RepID=A0A6J4I8M7_9CYAN|nr:hypothetical protein AVDCRST_MAG92-1755 [uncultured Coleofasciculus sp.]